MANPRLRDIEAENLVNCKIDDADLKLFQDCRKQIRITDEQDAVNRGRWYNLPKNIDSHLLERMLYYRGQVAIFYTEEDDKWRILPYVGCGGIDEWGRLKKLKPLPFTGSAKVDETKVFMPGLERNIIYDVKLDDLTAEDFLEGAVILHDYTPQLSQYCIPRKELNESLCELEARCLPMLRTALTNSTGISGMRVNSPDEAYAVEIASKNLDEASLAGRKWIGIVGHQDFQGFDGSRLAASATGFWHPCGEHFPAKGDPCWCRTRRWLCRCCFYAARPQRDVLSWPWKGRSGSICGPARQRLRLLYI